MLKREYLVPAVDYAAQMLIYLSRYKNMQATLTQISSDLDINKSTVYRILKTLEVHKLIYYDKKNKQYSLGIYHSVLGNRVNESLNYLKLINPYLIEANERTGLTVALIQQVSVDRLMFVSQIETNKNPKLIISVGNRFPMTEVSYGKWFLAYMDQEIRDKYLAKGLKKVTNKTNTDIDEYIHQLEEIKLEKVLISRGEYTEGITAVSSPIFDSRGKVLSVITVLGMSDTISEKEINEYTKVLRDVSSKCNEELSNIYVESPNFPLDNLEED